ncbi:MAG: transcription elongation factor GreA [Candidatus Cloacimonetes bacterium]|nr:transcription elongation factor GreA [Candidatus Cloacimonadota bacterium]
MSDYITREGMNILRQRMEYLVRQRSEIIKQVASAREMGDLSENAEYHAAREQQRVVEKEYNHLRKRVMKLKVIDAENIPKDAVRFGARVTIREVSQGRIRKIRLVGIDEVFHTDDQFERMSIASPIGEAMIGRKKGDHFQVRVPIGKREFEILDIE